MSGEPITLLVLSGMRHVGPSIAELTDFKNTLRSHVQRRVPDAVLILGGVSDDARPAGYDRAGEVVDHVLEACIDYGGSQELPPVYLLPGSSDRLPLPAGRFPVKALTELWHQAEPGLWSGDSVELVQAVGDSFERFESWAAPYRSDSGWRSGLLAGDGSSKMRIGGLDIGLIAVNSCFRMLAKDADPSLVTASAEQVDAAVGQDVHEWARDCALVIVATGEAPLWTPNLPRPTLALAGKSAQAPSNRWLSLSDRSRPSVCTVNIGLEDPSDPEVTVCRSPSDVGTVLRAAVIRPIESRSPEVNGRTQGRAVGTSSTASGAEYHDDFRRDLSTGRMVLIVASGLAQYSVSENGLPLMEPDEYRAHLLSSMDVPESGSPPPLHEVMIRAKRHFTSRRADLLEPLTEAADSRNHIAHLMLKGPWARIYDFTGTNIFFNALRQEVGLEDTVSVTDARDSFRTPEADRLEVIAMNGFPGSAGSVDFVPPSELANDARTSWFNQLSTDVLLRPILIVATDLASETLWTCLRLVNDPNTGSTLDYPQYLVAAGGREAEVWRLNGFPVQHLQENISEFSKSFLKSNQESVSQGLKNIARRRTRLIQGTGLQLVKHLIDQAEAGTSDLLRGYEPTWGDVRDDVAVRLSSVVRIQQHVEAPGKAPVVIVAGRAGSGKSTTLMRLAAEMNTQGKSVGWVDRDASQKSKEIIRLAEEMDLDAVMIDDVEMFGARAPVILRQLNRSGRTIVVGTVRSVRADVVDAVSGATRINQDEPLSDHDIESLLGALERNRLLGKLRRHLPPERVAEFRKLSDRDLLAGMVEVVSGMRFEEKIRSEYVQLDDHSSMIYSIVCLFEEIVYKTTAISYSELLGILSSNRANPKDYSVVKRLVKQRMLVEIGDQQLRSRHRAIAGRVVELLKKSPPGLAELIKRMLWYYASLANNISDSNHTYRRIMIKLINHAEIKRLGLPTPLVREIYQSVHPLLHNDFHYWLQCSRYEVEEDGGDIELAASYLESARGCPGGESDPYVATTRGAVCLRRSRMTPSDQRRFDEAIEAYRELQEVFRKNGINSPHTFVMLVREGCQWLVQAKLVGQEEKRRIGLELLDTVKLGRRIGQGDPEILRTADLYEPALVDLVTPTDSVPL
ncbi:hypothetical protein [Cryptosporangium sp. NPDC051539]|uniref:ATP-binding protein n=1 Tax=Cryptosporangium sp. NPDC051539 TaxID=3363962 RepID=UPI0037897EF2